MWLSCEKGVLPSWDEIEDYIKNFDAAFPQMYEKTVHIKLKK